MCSQVPDDETVLSMVVAKPAEACGPIENDVRGKVVLVRRGSCPFVRKAEEVQAAGGRAVVVGSINPYIVRMVSIFMMMLTSRCDKSVMLQGVEPRWKGLNAAIPVVMVSKRAYR